MIYLSHPISPFGNYSMEQHVQIALDFATRLRKEGVEGLYVPAESEPFVNRAFKEKMLTVDQILQIDCQIINTCDGVIFFMPYGRMSSWMKVELDSCPKELPKLFTEMNINPDVLKEFILETDHYNSKRGC